MSPEPKYFFVNEVGLMKSSSIDEIRNFLLPNEQYSLVVLNKKDETIAPVFEQITLQTLEEKIERLKEGHHCFIVGPKDYEKRFGNNN